jgi:hypothetical protein
LELEIIETILQDAGSRLNFVQDGSMESKYTPEELTTHIDKLWINYQAIRDRYKSNRKRRAYHADQLIITN